MKILREFTTTATLNSGTDTDREIKIAGKVLENEEIVLEPEDGAFELKLGHAALSELRRTK
jgi:hypothetical protein